MDRFTISLASFRDCSQKQDGARVQKPDKRPWVLLAAVLCTGLLSLLSPTPLGAQTSDPSNPPPTDAPSTVWATWLNGLAPQAVPQETIGLGGVEFNSSTSWAYECGGLHMVWAGFSMRQAPPPPFACQGGGGGLVTTALWAPVVPINSYNERYQILIAKPTNLDLHDLQAVLTVPTGVGGSESFTATLQQSSSPPGLGPGQSLIGGIVATIDFHPRTSLPQTLRIWSQPARVEGDYTIVPFLQPQLGGFVVPYVPIAVIHQPPGCGQCVADTPQGPVTSACGSSATYGVTTKHGVTVSWTDSSTSGIVKTESPQDFLGYVSKGAEFASFAAGVIPGGQAAAGAFKTMGQVVDTLKGLYQQSTTTTTTITQSQTEARGWVITDSEDWNTAECQNEDMAVYLQNVLFVYVVVPIDPVSGNVSLSGIPTVVLAPLKWSGAYQRTFSQLQAELPPTVLKQFRALDANRGKSGNVGFPDVGFGRRRSRLVDLKVTECPAPTTGNPPHPIDAPHDVYLSEEELRSSGTSDATTVTTVNEVTGLLAPILGQASHTTQSFTHSTDVTSWSSVTPFAALHLLCPELAPGAPGQEMNIQLDTLFDTLIAVPGPIEWNTPQILGMITDQQGRPVGNREVLLKTGGKTYSVFSDAGGKYAFRFASIPKGSGALVVGNNSMPIHYNGTPLADQNFKIGSGLGATSILGKTVGGANLGNAVNPGQPCCDITSIDAATGTVAARVNATGQPFQFMVKDSALVRSLKVGQGVYANFKTRQASVNGKDVCCQIVGLGSVKPAPVAPTTGGAPASPIPTAQTRAGGPCCQITAINQQTGMVTAKVNATGQTFEFKVMDVALLRTLKVGQALFANLANKQVSLDGKTICCPIVAVRPMPSSLGVGPGH